MIIGNNLKETRPTPESLKNLYGGTIENNIWYSQTNSEKTSMSKIQKLSEYAKEKGVSRQYIYAYFQSQIIDLPIFVEFEGQRIEVGRQKFIKIDGDK